MQVLLCLTDELTAMTPQLGDKSEPGLGVGSSTKSSSPWVSHGAVDRNAHCRWKDGKRKPLPSHTK